MVFSLGVPIIIIFTVTPMIYIIQKKKEVTEISISYQYQYSKVELLITVNTHMNRGTEKCG